MRHSLHSNKFSKVSSVADRIEAACSAMGLEVRREGSRISASTYLYVTAPDQDDSFKVRISDHDAVPGVKADCHAFDGDCPSAAIAKVAEHFGRQVPSGLSTEDFARRAAASAKSATTRKLSAALAEKDMEARVVEELSTGRLVNAVEAGRVIDRLFLGVPRAQRQRMAQAAALTARNARQAAGAA